MKKVFIIVLIVGLMVSSLATTFNATGSGNELAITSDQTQELEQGLILNDEQLVELFNVQVPSELSSDSLEVTHQIDFETPGFYNVKFSIGDLEKIVRYQVMDLKPSLDSNDEYTSIVGNQVDIIEAYQVNAAEFQANDLNQNVIIDDDNIDYTKVGDYIFSISVSDDEGNIVFKELTLHIVDEQVLNAKPRIIGELGIEYNDEQLKELFDLTANYDLDLNQVVVTHQIDFDEVGEYQITFTDPKLNITVSSVYDVASEIETELYIKKICIKLGEHLTSQSFIQIYNQQAEQIKDQAVINTLQIDDSKVDYSTAGSYQIVVRAINNADQVLTRVLMLCIEDEESEVASEIENKIKNDVCLKANRFGKPISLVSAKIKTITITPGEMLSDTKLRTLFGQPDEVVVIHNIIPNKVGNYSIRFENGDCSFSGNVQVIADRVIQTTSQTGLNELESEDEKNGEQTEQEAVETIVYKLTNTGNRNLLIYAVIMLAGVGLIILLIRFKNKG